MLRTDAFIDAKQTKSPHILGEKLAMKVAANRVVDEPLLCLGLIPRLVLEDGVLVPPEAAAGG